MPNNVRDYGLGDVTQYIKGVPRVTDTVPIPCPNCGCETTYAIHVDVENLPLMKTQHAVGSYVGCAACPWASPIVVICKKEKSNG